VGYRLFEDPVTSPSSHDTKTLHGLIGGLARAEPERLALSEGEKTMTFFEVWAEAGGIAGALEARGVKTGDVVAVAMPRSARLVIACLAVMRAGGIVLALDLRHPAVRNRRLMDAAGVSCSVIDGSTAPECAGHTAVIDAREAGNAPSPAAEAEVRGADSGFVVFTSGSSGEPKGVLISHAAMVERSRIEHGLFGFTPRDLYLLRTSPMLIGLPVALEIFASGVPLRIAPEPMGDDASALADLIQASRVTFAGFPPRLIESLLALPEAPAKLASLRVLRSSGEALRPRLAASIRDALPSCRVVDGYGTSETAGIVLLADVPQSVDPGAPSLPGRPLPGVAIRLVGEDSGSTDDGEIWVSSPMLASGYLAGGGADGSRFMVEPESPGSPRARWYRTGDRGRRLADGRFVVLGRLDVQLNVDGVRLDPVEVENALRGHASVRDAAVWMHPDASGRSRLIAYVVDQSAPAAPAELRSFLAGSLPPALIPARFIHLHSLPLTSSGKVDRARLPTPDFADGGSSGMPRNDAEAKVLALFREVLDAPGLGTDDVFFEWGGDSLKAFALMTRISDLLGVRLPAAALLDAPTAAGLAKEIARGDPGQVSAVWLRRAGDLAPLACLPGLAGDPLWFHPLLEALDRRQPILGLSFVGLKPPISIPAAASRAVDALRGEQPRGPYFLLGHSVGGVLAFEMARELLRQGETVGLLGMIDSYVPGSRRILPMTGAARVAKRLRRFRNRMIGSARERLKESLSRFGLGTGERGPVFIPGLKEAAMSHRSSPCDLRITLFRANERTLGSDLAADWALLARGGVEVKDIAGHHFNLITGGRARELSARIAEVVSRALTSGSRGSSSRSR